MKLRTQTQAELLKSLLLIHIPPSYLIYFELISVESDQKSWYLHMEERIDLLPEELGDKSATSLDGFCNGISILTSSALNKPIYIVIKRRRWKQRGSNKHHSNTYDLHPTGAKITHEYANFLKGIH